MMNPPRNFPEPSARTCWCLVMGFGPETRVRWPQLLGGDDIEPVTRGLVTVVRAVKEPLAQKRFKVLSQGPTMIILRAVYFAQLLHSDTQHVSAPYTGERRQCLYIS